MSESRSVESLRTDITIDTVVVYISQFGRSDPLIFCISAVWHLWTNYEVILLIVFSVISVDVISSICHVVECMYRQITYLANINLLRINRMFKICNPCIQIINIFVECSYNSIQLRDCTRVCFDCSCICSNCLRVCSNRC